MRSEAGQELTFLGPRGAVESGPRAWKFTSIMCHLLTHGGSNVLAASCWLTASTVWLLGVQ